MWHYGCIDKFYCIWPTLLMPTYVFTLQNNCLNHSGYLGYSQAEETVVMRGLQWALHTNRIRQLQRRLHWCVNDLAQVILQPQYPQNTFEGIITISPSNWYSCFWSGVFPGNDVGGRGLSNLETKYFETKHYSSLTPYTTAKWDTYKRAQKQWIKCANMTDTFPVLLNYFSLLHWWQSIFNSPRI